MSRVTADTALRSKLSDLSEQIEICDESGNTLGHFLPWDIYYQMRLAWANSQVTDEELEESRKASGGRTLEEIWKRLGVQ